MTEIDVLLEDFNNELKEIKDKYAIINRKISELNLPQEKYRNLIRKMGEDFFQISTELIDNVSKKELAEQRLLESEENFRFITENVNDVIIILNKDLKVEYVNELPLNRIAGYHSEDLIDKNGIDYIHPEDLAKALNVFTKSFQTGEASIEIRLRHKNGHYVWTEAKGNIILDQDENPKAHIIVRDISQRKIAEEKLRNSEERLKLINQELEEQAEISLRESQTNLETLVNSIYDFLFVIEFNGNILKVNNAVLNRLGYTKEEILNMTLLDLHPPDRHDEAKTIVAQMLEDKTDSCIIPIMTKNGELIPVETKITKGLWGEKEAFFGISRDITKRIKSEQNLKESEERYRSLFENMNAGFAYHKVITDDNNKPIDYKYLEVNPAFEKLTGLKAEDMIGKTVTEILPGTENDPADWIGRFGNVGLTGVPLIVEDYSDAIDKWFKVSGYSPKKGYFAVTFTDITERKKAEQKLKESEEKFRTMAENSLIGISITQDSHIKYMNKKNAEIMGYSPNEMLNWDFEDLFKHIYPEDLPRVRKNMEIFTLKSEERSNHIENRVITKAGKVIWVDNVSARIHYEGKPARLIATVDITDRKIAEQKLKESEEKFRTLFEVAPASIMVADLDSNILMCNEKFCRVHGFENPELVKGRKFPEFISENDRLKLSEGVKMTIGGKSRDIISYTMLKNDGTAFPAEATSSAIKDKDGNIIGIIGVAQDITKRQKAEQIVKESEEKFRTIAEQSFMGIIILQEEKVRYVNKAAATMFGYSLEEVMSWSKQHIVEICIHPEDLPILREKRELRRKGEFNLRPYISYRVITKLGKIKWIDQFSRNILYQGKVAELISIIDITDQKEAEKIITEENKKLVELDQMRKDLITRVSHELKTPLVSIFSCSELLIDYYKEQMSEEVMKFVEIIHRGGKRLKDLIKNLLDASQIDAGKLKINKEKANLIEIIRNCIDYVKFLVDDRKISLDYDFPEELFVEVDKIRIEQVFTNILSNAVKNTPSNGNIGLNATEEDNQIYITIKDTGVGLTKKEMEKIFKKFGKIERYGKELDVDIEGSGLGLYISKEIVNLHEGMIWVESEGRNKGATFTIKLPTRK